MGIIEKVSGPLVVANDMLGSNMYDVVHVGNASLIGEIIQLRGENAVIQVYEDTTGLRPGEPVESTELPLSVKLGPGLLGNIYDGIQRPLELLKKKSGAFIGKGIVADPIDKSKKWKFVASRDVKKGGSVKEGDIIGYVQETDFIKHQIMVPYGVKGKIKKINSGTFTIEDVVAEVESGKETFSIKMSQSRSVRKPSKVNKKFRANEPLITGQRSIDTLFPIAKGGTSAIPGPFGAGKCVAGETNVILADGSIVRMDQLYLKSKEGGNTTIDSYEEVINTNIELNSLTGSKIRKSASSTFYKGMSDSVVKVKTRTGRTVRVTPVHKLFKISEEGAIIETMAKDLRVGDFIASVRKLDMNPADADIDIYQFDGMLDARAAGEEMKEIASGMARDILRNGVSVDLDEKTLTRIAYGDNTPRLRWIKRLSEALRHKPVVPVKLIGDRYGNETTIPQMMNPDLAEFLGYFVSEGYVRNENTIVFTNLDEQLLSRFTELALAIFGVEGIKDHQKDKTPNVLVHSRVLARFLDAIGVGNGAANKAIPDILMRSGNISLASFLTAYFIGDGSFSDGEVEFATASKTLQTQLSYLLARFGVLNTMRERRIEGTTYYRLFVRGMENLALLSKVLEGDNRKVMEVAAYVNSGRHPYTAIDIVPISPYALEQIYREDLTYSDLLKEGIEIHNYIGNKEKMSRATFQKFARYLST